MNEGTEPKLDRVASSECPVDIEYSREMANGKGSARERGLGQLADRLRQSEEQFRAMFQVASIGIAQADPRTGQWLRANDKMCAITGYSEAELLQLHIPDITHPDDRKADWEAFQRVVRGEEADYRMEKRYVRKDGVLIWVNVNMTVIRDAAGQPTRTIAAIEDITSRKRAEQALRQSEEKHRVLYESSRDAIMTLAPPDWRFHSGNSATLAMFRAKDEAELVSHGPGDLSPEHQPDGQLSAVKAREMKEKAVREGAHFFEWTHKRLNGEEFPATVLLTRFEWEGRTMLQATVRDIAEIKLAQAELAKAHQELLQSLRQVGKGEVATGVLHNVANVLNSVNVSAGLMQERIRNSRVPRLEALEKLLREHEDDLGVFFTLDSRGRKIPEYLHQLTEMLAEEHATIRGEVDLLRQNIDHISGIIATQQAYACSLAVTEVVNIAELIEDALRLDSDSIARRGIQVVKNCQDTPQITVEKHKLLQILVNLLRNAKYACEESGRPDKQIALSVTNTRERVCIVVKDNGVGIPRENLAHIFTHGFTTRKGGHGFGLHSSLLAARESGGDLNVHSEGFGKGATFTLELPLVPPKLI